MRMTLAVGLIAMVKGTPEQGEAAELEFNVTVSAK
jgi:hypothetical protein